VEFLILFAVIAIVLVVPVMLGARIVNARNRGFGSALLAVLVLAALSAVINGAVANGLIATFAMAILGAVALASILGTTFLRGLAVSIIASIIQFGVVILLAMAVFGSA
jgi:hypothetical protein